MSTLIVRAAIALLAASAMFLLGSVWQRQFLKETVNRSIAATMEELDRGNYENAFVKLVPRITEVGAKLSVESGAGGIHALGNDVIGVTRGGEFFLYRSGGEVPSLSKLDIRAENNLEAFQAHVRARGFNDELFVDRFRFIDLVLADAPGGAWLIISHHYWNEGAKCFTLRLSKLSVGGKDRLSTVSAGPDDWTTLFESRPCLKLKDTGERYAGHQHGGRMALLPDGKLLLTVGDFNYDGYNSPANLPQDRDADYGKILRIDITSGRREIFSFGHRNPQGLGIDRDGNIWSTEHGPEGGDELNLIRPGANYGWPSAINGTQYLRHDWPIALKQGRHDGFEAPMFSWTPSIGIANVMQVRGFSPRWDGDLLVSSMGRRTLFRMRYKHGRMLFAEPIRVGHRVRDIDQLENGNIVLWTDLARIVEIAPGDPDAEPVDKAQESVLAGLEAPLKKKVESAIASCRMCHSTSAAGSQANAPSLWGVHRRPIASTSYRGYSAALREREGVWSEKRLMAFLEDCDAWAPGTSMAFAGIPDARVRRKVVEYLTRLKDPV